MRCITNGPPSSNTIFLIISTFLFLRFVFDVAAACRMGGNVIATLPRSIVSTRRATGSKCRIKYQIQYGIRSERKKERKSRVFRSETTKRHETIGETKFIQTHTHTHTAWTWGGRCSSSDWRWRTNSSANTLERNERGWKLYVAIWRLEVAMRLLRNRQKQYETWSATIIRKHTAPLLWASWAA